MAEYVVTLYSGKMDGMLVLVRDVESEQQALEMVTAIESLQLVRFTDGTEDFIGFARPDADEDPAAVMAQDMMIDGAPRWWWQAWIEEIRWGHNHPKAVTW